MSDSEKLARTVEVASISAHIPAGDKASCPHAEVTVNLTAPFPSWRWVKMQLLGINWATLALLVAVLAVSSGINKQLDEMRAQGITSQRQYDNLQVLVTQASDSLAQLQLINNDCVAFNATLGRAEALGLTNLTGDIDSVREGLLGFDDDVRGAQEELLGFGSDVRTVRMDISNLNNTLADRTAVFGFQVFGTTQLPFDPSAGGSTLQFDANVQWTFDTSGGFDFATGVFTATRSGTWRFDGTGTVQAVAGSIKNVGIILSRGGAAFACAPVWYKTSMVLPSGTDIGFTVPGVSLDMQLLQGEKVSLCGWASGDAPGPVNFGIPPSPGKYGQLMKFSGKLL
jgi:hypothetical protein